MEGKDKNKTWLSTFAGDRPFDNMTDKLRTVPFDPRFPHSNQTRNCWQNFVDYHRCTNLKGKDFEPCQFFWKNFNTLCPSFWIEKWNEQIEEGTFPTRLD